MNRIIIKNQNLIKQPAQCCIYCGKSYKRKTNLSKHVELCELINNSKKCVIADDEEDDIPSQKKMYRILLELGQKYSRLEEKVDELNKWVIKKKKKMLFEAFARMINRLKQNNERTERTRNSLFLV